MRLQLKPSHCFMLYATLGFIKHGSMERHEIEGVTQIGPKIASEGPSAIYVEERNFWDLINPLKWAQDWLISSYLKAKRDLTRQPVCYENIGCFNLSENMRLKEGGPQSPQDVNTTFYFFNNSTSSDIDDLLNENKTTENPEKTWTLDNWTLESTKGLLDPNNRLTVVTHGLTGSKRTPWMMPLVIAILENLGGTVLVVDWGKGANGSYTDAGVNTPMPGALISLLLQKIITSTGCSISPQMIYLVGFSMGAQVMGFAGRHFHKTTKMLLGRITGLDPAGYLFENTNVTLSKHDAEFVDIIHTQAGNIYDFKLGLKDSVGHVDFYPNGGSVQQGCPADVSPTAKTFWDDFTCSHYRAPKLFIESLNNSSCTFYSYRCKDWNDFKTGDCVKNANRSDIGVMGYYSRQALGRGDQYLYTNQEPPYCRGNNTSPPPSGQQTVRKNTN